MGTTEAAVRALGALLPYLVALSVVTALVLARAGAVLQPHRPLQQTGLPETGLPETGLPEDAAAAA